MCFGQLAHTCRLTCKDAWNKKNVCPHNAGFQSKTNCVPHIAQPTVRITRNCRRTPTKNQTACRNHQQKKTKTELKKSCTTHRTLVNAEKQLSAVTPMKCSVENRAPRHKWDVSLHRVVNRGALVLRRKPTCQSKDSTDSIMESTTNTMYVVPPMFIVGTNPQHTMTQQQYKSHGNQGNYHNDVELQTWCTLALATLTRNIWTKLCDLHIMLL